MIENLKYGFFWILTIALAATLWAFISVEEKGPRCLGFVILGVGALWETYTTATNRNRYFKVATAEELTEIGLAKRSSPKPKDGATVAGYFFGRMRFRTRGKGTL